MDRADDSNARLVRLFLRLTAGFLLWALHLGVIYAANGLACTVGLAAFIVPAIILAATLVAAGGCLWIAIRALRAGRPWGFYPFIEAGVAAGGLIAILWQALPALMLPSCG